MAGHLTKEENTLLDNSIVDGKNNKEIKELFAAGRPGLTDQTIDAHRKKLENPTRSHHSHRHPEWTGREVLHG